MTVNRPLMIFSLVPLIASWVIRAFPIWDEFSASQRADVTIFALALQIYLVISAMDDEKKPDDPAGRR